MTNRSMGEIVRRQNPACLPARASVQEACRLMRDRRIGAILVTDDQGRLVGLFTGRDAVTRVGAEARDPAATTLEQVMTRNPDTTHPRTRAIEVLRLMSDAGYRHLPILDEGRIVGIVSKGDFLGLERARHDDETGFWEIM
ncbi:MAG: CBS domain-containing protein [Proteobacteria bacterium]|nr:CBS domain-containing protein [Pseudomonadota bacterium]